MEIKIGKIRIKAGYVWLFLIFLGMVCLVYVNNFLYKVIQVLYIFAALAGCLAGRQKLFLKDFPKYYVIFYVYAVFTVLWTYGTVEIDSLLVMTLISAILIISYGTLRRRNSLVPITWIMILSAAAITLYIMFRIDIKNLIGARLDAGFINSNRYGTFIAYTSVFAAYLADRYKKRFLLLFMPLFMGLILVSGSKSALLLLLLLLFVYYYMSRVKGSSSFLRMLLASVSVIILVIWLLMNVQWAYDILGYRFLRFISDLFSGIISYDPSSITLGSGSTMLRIDMIYHGLRFFIKSPLFGYGIYNFKYLYGPLHGYVTFAHNNYIELLVDTGIIGVCIYYYPRFRLLTKIMKERKRNAHGKSIEIALCMAVIIGVLAEDFTTVSYASMYQQFLVSIVYAAVSGRCRNSADNVFH